MPVHLGANQNYPHIWVRWVTQQVRVGVSCELKVSNPLALPHLRRLPLVITAPGVNPEQYLRHIIAAADAVTPDNAHDRVDVITAAVLADEAVSIAEPDLQTMVSWWLAEHHTLREKPVEQGHVDDDWLDHECLDPEAVAADLVRSGLIAPAWTAHVQSAPKARSVRTDLRRRAARTDHQAVSPLQIALPIQLFW